MSGGSGDDRRVFPIMTEIASGRHSACYLVDKFGENGTIGASYEDIWSPGGTLVYLTSAETMNIASGAAADASGGTGARTIQIYGLNNDYEEINETITLNGTSDVETSNSYLRVYRMVVRSAGSGGANAGAITATASSAATLQASISAGDNQTQMTHFTVPKGQFAILFKVTIFPTAGNRGRARLLTRPVGEVFQVKRTFNLTDNQVDDDWGGLGALLLPAKTDIKIIAQRTAGSDITVSAVYQLFVSTGDS